MSIVKGDLYACFQMETARRDTVGPLPKVACAIDVDGLISCGEREAISTGP